MQKRAIQRVLVACRGELGASVARRIEAGGGEDGTVEAVALYADVDADDPWLDEVAYATRLLATPGVDPYADGLRIVGAALDAGSDAVHPGVGPLAGSAEMAHMVANVGLAWIGAPPGLLAVVADRAEVRRLAREGGLAIVPSSPPLTTLEDAAPWLARLGVPLRVAPAVRYSGVPAVLVTAREQLEGAVAALGGRPFVVERAIVPARHVTLAVVGDGAGNAMVLGDHERSLVLEGRVRVRECPAPCLDDALRERLGAAAVHFAAGMRVLGVGAVEFLVGADGHWWLHDLVPALFEGFSLHDTVYGLDLVHAQLRLAAGETLGWSPEDIASSRCAIELTLCATGPGDLDVFELPDPSVCATHRGPGGHVDPDHDPVLARVRLAGPLRQAVLVRAHSALQEVRIEGVPHDTDALLALLGDPRAWGGRTDTGLLASVVAARSPARSGE